MKYSAYGVGSYDSQSQYFPYVDILNLTVEKIPYNIEAAAAAVAGSNHPTQSTFINMVKYGIKLRLILVPLGVVYYIDSVEVTNSKNWLIYVR